MRPGTLVHNALPGPQLQMVVVNRFINQRPTAEILDLNAIAQN